MKVLILSASIFLLSLISSFDLFYNQNKSGNTETSEKETLKKTPLNGTWKLIKARWGDMEKLEETEDEVYKIYTDSHVFFIYYNAQAFKGAGGGTYQVNGQEFTENLDYFSWDSTNIGTPQTFTWQIEDDILHQNGLLTGGDQYDQYLIDEYYERVVYATEKPNKLVGVWQLNQATYGNDTYEKSTAKFTAKKVFTPRHWYGVFYDPNTGQFDGLGFGTYELEGDQYLEHVEAFSWDQSAVGRTYTFTMEITPKTLLQTGMINTDTFVDYTVIEQSTRIE